MKAIVYLMIGGTLYFTDKYSEQSMTIEDPVMFIIFSMALAEAVKGVFEK